MGVHIKLEGDRIADLRFHGQGCAISQATASIISDELKGKTVAEVAGLDRNFVAEEIGIELSPTRLKCGLLSLKVVQGALLGTDEWPSGTPGRGSGRRGRGPAAERDLEPLGPLESCTCSTRNTRI